MAHWYVLGFVQVNVVFILPMCLQVGPSSLQQQLAAESLYRDANSLLYADNKPSEDAVDRVISKINKEYVCFTTTQIVKS